MSSVTILGDTSGSVAISAPSVAGSTAITIAAQSGTLNVGGPAFSAGRTGSTQALSTSWNKVQCNSEDFDTNNNYDNTTNYRFTPTVAGYYQISGAVCLTSQTSGSSEFLVSIWKNGAEWKRGFDSVANAIIQLQTSTLVYLNGSTDYVELYTYVSATNNVNNSSAYTWFQGFLARTA